MLTELIAKNAGDTQEHRRYYPSPSKVGKCPRALTYHAIGIVPDPLPDRALLIFDDGHWHEELLKDHIRKTVFQLIEWKGPKQRVHIATIAGQDMTGELDGLLQDPMGAQWLLELKSINHFSFERLDADPLPEHRRQVNLYLHGLLQAGLPIRKALILYKNKNTAAMKEFVIEYDPALALADIALFAQVAGWAAAKTVPPRPYEPTDWHCSYCPWQRTCWKGYVDEVGQLAADVALDEELATTARYYNELGAHIREQEKERDGLKTRLRAALQTAEARSGRAGEYLITLTAQERETVNKALVPPEAKTTIMSERLTVKRLKEDA